MEKKQFLWCFPSKNHVLFLVFSYQKTKFFPVFAAKKKTGFRLPKTRLSQQQVPCIVFLRVERAHAVCGFMQSYAAMQDGNL